MRWCMLACFEVSARAGYCPRRATTDLCGFAFNLVSTYISDTEQLANLDLISSELSCSR